MTGYFGSDYFASRFFASYYFRAATAPPPPPPTPTPSGGIGAIVIPGKCKNTRKRRQQLLAEKTTASLTEVGNMLVPTVLLCPTKHQTPWMKKKKRLQINQLLIHDFDIIEAEKGIRR